MCWKFFKTERKVERRKLKKEEKGVLKMLWAKTVKYTHLEQEYKLRNIVPLMEYLGGIKVELRGDWRENFCQKLK